jgi:hypothetical protein
MYRRPGIRQEGTFFAGICEGPIGLVRQAAWLSRKFPQKHGFLTESMFFVIFKRLFSGKPGFPNNSILDKRKNTPII